MVIRSIVSGIVYSIPMSDKLVPNVIANMIKEPESSVNEMEAGAKLEENTKAGQEDRILQRILERREANKSPLSMSPPSYLQFDDDYYPTLSTSFEPIHKLNSVSSCKRRNVNDIDGSTMVPSSSSLNNSEHTHTRRVSFSEFPPLEISPSTPSSRARFREEMSNERVRRYLNEQNDKFDNLINRNIEVVFDEIEEELMEEQRQVPQSLQGTIVDLLDVRDRNISHKIQDITNIAVYAASGLNPWKPMKVIGSNIDDNNNNNNHNNKNKNSDNIDIPGSNSSSPVTSSGSGIDGLELELQNFAIEETFESLLLDLDRRKKVQLYKFLQDDLDVFEDAKEDISPLPSLAPTYEIDVSKLQESGITIDKIQALAIILIRLFFAAIKLSIPIAIRLYHKFTANELYMINKKNFNNLLGYLIKLLKVIEEKVNGDTMKGFQYGNIQNPINHDESNGQKEFDRMYDEMTANATDFLSKQLTGSTADVILKDSSWKGIALGFVLNRCLALSGPQRVARRINKNDPKYSVYYSKNRSSSEGDLSRPLRQGSVLSYEDDNEGLNILRAAEKFASEF